MPTEYLCKQCIIILALCSCKIKLLDGVTMDEKEQIPAGIITMLLKGYVETIAFQRKLICAAATLLRVLPSCCVIDNNAALQVQATAAGTISNVSLSVVKMA